MAEYADYDVALWRFWPALFSSHDGCVKAQSALLAVLALMEQHQLKHVAYAAVGLPAGGGITRFRHGISRYTGPVPSEYSTEDEKQEVEA
jgi:hypothetical protein